MTTGIRSQRKAASPAILAVGDAAAIVLFAVIGLANHKEGITGAGLARNVLPILGVWFVAAPFVGTYARPGARTLLGTWLLAVPIGVTIRALALNRAADGSQIVFGIVTLVATLILLLAWRGIASFAAARGNRPAQL